VRADVGAERGVDLFADEHRAPELLREGLEARGEVHGVGDHRGLEALRLADGAHHDPTHVHAHADGQRDTPARLLVRAPQLLLHGDRRAHGVARITRKKRHDRVADVLVHEAALRAHVRPELREAPVEEREGLLGGHALTRGGEVPDVREEHRDGPRGRVPELRGGHVVVAERVQELAGNEAANGIVRRSEFGGAIGDAILATIFCLDSGHRRAVARMTPPKTEPPGSVSPVVTTSTRKLTLTAPAGARAGLSRPP